MDSVLSKQVLLANDAIFTDERLLARGCAFLIQDENQVWAVTGRPWQQGDTSAVISNQQLRGTIQSWRLYPRGPLDIPKDTIEVRYDSSQSTAYKEDILVLKAPSRPTGFAALKPQFELPIEDDTLFLIGCPLDEPGCRQKVYPMIFQKYTAKWSILTFLLLDEVNTNGFGGAPIVNRQGEVVALLTGGGKFADLEIVRATHIKAIKQPYR